MVTRLTRLDQSAKRFFNILSEVIFTNPFGIERTEVERLATEGTSVAKPREGEHHFMALIPLVDAQLNRLRASGISVIAQVPADEQAVLRHAFLFRSYHRYVAHFDALIRTQLEQPQQSVEAAFADEATTELRAVGFRAAQAAHYFALFYQLRRAYYFIARALVGENTSMRSLREALWNNVFTYDEVLWSRMEDYSTLLLGETGTGKGSASEALGRSGQIPFDLRSRRFASSFTDAFIATNLSQFRELLIESELFGHRKGAFTGAVSVHEGLFARCREYGTLFLDEIGDVSASVQRKLLRVLQERLFAPVGSHRQQRFAGCVVAATNQSLDELRAVVSFATTSFIVCVLT
jgi:sigma-54 specific flagellar transcriptional regulator A